LEYVGADNQKHRPVMIHRAPFGSMERFVAVLLEHCAGDFPLWLSTEQFIVLPISDKYNEYAEKVLEFLNNYDIRGLVDDRNEKIGKKIRDAELAKVPFMLIVGEKEFESNQVSVRQRGAGDHGSITQEAFVAMVQEAIAAELS
jgi:threonyl-tRNA synthetase